MSPRLIFGIGASLMFVGLLMIPLPGPGLLVVGLGLLVTVTGVVMFAAHRSGGHT